MSNFIVRPGVNLVDMLKAAGYSTYRIAKSTKDTGGALFGSAAMTKFRRGGLPSWGELSKLVQLLNVSPYDLIAYQTDDGNVYDLTGKQLLDGPQPAQAPQPQPDTPPAPAPATSTPQPPEGYTLIPDRPGLEPIKVLLPVDKRYNQRIYAAVKQGRAPSGAMYVMAALDKQLAADEADEKRKLDRYFAAMDDDY